MYRPPIIGEPHESLLDGIAARQWLGMSRCQITAVTTADEQNPHTPNGLSMEREPQEEPEAVFDIGRQLRDPPEAP